MKKVYEKCYEMTSIDSYEIDYYGNSVSSFRGLNLRHEMSNYYETTCVDYEFDIEMFCDTYSTRIA